MKPTVDGNFWRGIRIAFLPAVAVWLLLAVLLGGCASHPVPEVSAEDAADCPGCDGGGVQHKHRAAQAWLAVMDILPGANFFLIPVEYSLTGTTGLTEFWHVTCDGAGGTFDDQTGDCSFDEDVE